jgi:hypothetical protein
MPFPQVTYADQIANDLVEGEKILSNSYVERIRARQKREGYKPPAATTEPIKPPVPGAGARPPQLIIDKPTQAPPVTEKRKGFMSRFLNTVFPDTVLPTFGGKGTLPLAGAAAKRVFRPGFVDRAALAGLKKSTLFTEPIAEVVAPRLLHPFSGVPWLEDVGFDYGRPNPASERAALEFITGRGEMSGPELAGFLRQVFQERPIGEQIGLGVIGDPLNILLPGVGTAAKVIGSTAARGAFAASRSGVPGVSRAGSALAPRLMPRVSPTKLSSFTGLAKAQRGVAEGLATTGMTKAGASGARQFLAEHIGDIVHRMAQRPGFPDISLGDVLPKVRRSLVALEQKYGFAKEVEEQLRSNYQAAVQQGKFSGSYQQFRLRVTDMGEQYAKAHEGLPVVNQAHRDAQAAAVAYGREDYPAAIAALKRIEGHTGSVTEWSRYVNEGLTIRPKVPVIGGGAFTPVMAPLYNFNTVVEVSSRPDIWKTFVNMRAISKVVKPFNLSAVANNPVELAAVGRAVLRSHSKSLSEAGMSNLNALGSQEMVFGKISQEGLLLKGPLEGLSVNAIAANPSKYSNKLSDLQTRWLDAVEEIEQAKLAYLKKNGVNIKELDFQAGGRYASQHVFQKIAANGEVIDVRVMASPRQVGGKASFEKPRTVGTDIDRAIADGYRYLPVDDSVGLNLQGAYHIVIDDEMAKWLLKKVKTEPTVAPKELTKIKNVAKLKLGRAKKLGDSITKAVAGFRPSESTIRSIAIAYPQEARRLRSLVVRLQAPNPKTGRTVTKLTNRANALKAQTQKAYDEASKRVTEASAIASNIALGEGQVVGHPAFSKVKFTGPGNTGKEVAATLKSHLDSNFNGALNAVNQFNAVARYFMLAGDISLSSIQLLFLASYKPKIFGKAIGGFVQALFKPKFMRNYNNQVENIAVKQKYPGTQFGGGEFTEVAGKGGLLREEPLVIRGITGRETAKNIAKVPQRVAGKALRPFQRAFEAGLDIAGTELLKSLDHLGTDAARIHDISMFVNELRGLTDSAALGISVAQRQKETAVLLAPRYTRAIAALMFDVTRGNLRGTLARRAMAQGVLGVLAAYLAIGYARGMTFEELIDLVTPSSPTFLTFKVEGQNVGVGTKVRSVIKLLAATWEHPEELGSLNVGWGKKEFISNPLIKFVRGQSSPVVSTSWDLLTGKDFVSDPTREGFLGLGSMAMTKTAAKRIMPIWAQSVLLEGGNIFNLEDLKGKGIRGGAEFVGLRTYPRNRLSEVATEWKDIKEEYKERTTTKTRLSYRKSRAEAEAKLFILGEFTTLKNYRSRVIVRRLMRENKIDPKQVKGWENVFGSTELGSAPRTQPRQPWTWNIAERTRRQMPEPTPIRTKWSQVSSLMDSTLLKALNNIWNEGGSLNTQEERRFRRIFENVSFGESNFRTWLMRTLKQVHAESLKPQLVGGQ